MSAGGSGLQAPFVGTDALEGAAGDPMDIQGDDPEQQEEQQQRTDTEQQVISERSDWQTVGRLKVTPQEAYAQLLQQKKNCRASYWKHLEVILKDDATKQPSGKQCMLRCTTCTTLLAPSNTSRLGSSHFDSSGACKQAQAAQQRVYKRVRAGSSGSAPAFGSSEADSTPVECSQPGQRPITGFLTTPQQQGAAIDSLVRFLCKRATPYAIEDEDLRRCFALLGVDLPGRSRLCNTLIPQLYDNLYAEKMALLDLGAELICGLSTDGWRKKAAQQGMPLVNVCALLPDGGSFFVRVLPAHGVTKDGEWIAQQHLDLAEEITGGKPERLIGVVQDNTSANRKAMALLQKKQPTWVLVGCQAHALSLFIKDLNDGSKAKWGNWVLSRVAQMVNTINDSEAIRALVHCKQQELYKKVKAFASPCPTRWGSLIICARDLVASKQALINACTSAEWTAAARLVAYRDQFQQLAAGVSVGPGRDCRLSFWEHLDLLLELTQPIMDAIHTIEADAPLISQVLPMWLALETHVREFEDKYAGKGLHDNLSGALAVRVEKHLQPEFTAAYLLDPINFQQRAGEWQLPLSGLSAAQQADVLVVLMRLAGGHSDADVKREWATLRLSGISEPQLQDVMPALQVNKDGDVVRVPEVKLRRRFWSKLMRDAYPLISKAASRLLSMHATTAASERNWIVWGQVYEKRRNRLGLSLGEKIVFVRANLSKPARASDVDLVAELFD